MADTDSCTGSCRLEWSTWTNTGCCTIAGRLAGRVMREGEEKRRTNLEKDSLLLNTRVLARRLADGRARLDDSRGRGAA